MSRNRIVAILLSALVVLCPFQCIFLGRCTVGLTTKSHHCNCCGSEHRADNGKDCPDAPATPDQCPCRDCFCGGAVIEHALDLSVLQSPDLVIDFVHSAIALATGIATIDCAQVNSSSFLLPVINSGHSVRAALSCWRN
jgi:hypothetical protein